MLQSSLSDSSAQGCFVANPIVRRDSSQRLLTWVQKSEAQDKVNPSIYASIANGTQTCHNLIGAIHHHHQRLRRHYRPQRIDQLCNLCIAQRGHLPLSAEVFPHLDHTNIHEDWLKCTVGSGRAFISRRSNYGNGGHLNAD